MNIEQRMDAELAAVFATLPELGDITINPRASRQMEAEMINATQERPAGDDRVTTEERCIPGPEGEPDVPVRIYRPLLGASVLPGLLWLHGGGFVLGDLNRADPFCRRTASEVRCAIISVAYRLAPEHPFPAAVEDCYAALQWLASFAPALSVDRGRIAIGGVSAGGGLAAAVALMARDRQGPQLAFQLLLYPCLDDRHTTPSSHAVTDGRTWNRQTSLSAWRAYLGGAQASAYAAPARATNLSGLPPAYVLAAELDLLRDENIEYATRLMQAGVTTELHVFPATFHCFDGMVPTAEVSRRARAEIIAAMRHGLGA